MCPEPHECLEPELSLEPEPVNPTPQSLGSMVFNGIHADDGRYLLVASPEETCAVALGRSVEPSHARDLTRWQEIFAKRHLEVGFGLDPRRIEECGWGVILPKHLNPAILTALEPLLQLRRRQATQLDPSFYRELTVRSGESKQRFLARHGVGPDPVDPARMPYFLLIVGDPQAVPFHFQYQLDVQYAVGRLCFDTPTEYRSYAESVVAAEQGHIRRQHRLDVIATENSDDPATRRSLQELATPLTETLETRYPCWSVERSFGERAQKNRWLEILSGRESPALLLSISHGLGFSPDDPRQLDLQGALLCQDWPGPQATGRPLSAEHYLAADDLDPDADVAGLVAFHFGCFSAGTPAEDTFWRHSGSRRLLAPGPFVARLPQRLLAHPEGGALAVIGHVDQAWSHSFSWPEAGRQIAAWESTFGRLLTGYPVGAAMEYFNQRYAEVSCELIQALDGAEIGHETDPLELARLWTSAHDARSYMVLGDPAVRLAVDPGEASDVTDSP